MMRFIARSVKQIRRWPGLAAVLLSALFLQVVSQIGSSLLFKLILDDAIGAHRLQALVVGVSGLSGFLLLQGVSAVLQEFSIVRLTARSVNSLRQLFFERIQAHSPSFFERMPGGQIAETFGSDLSAMELATMRALPIVFAQSAIVVLAFVFLAIISWPLALITTASMAAIVFAPMPFANRAGGASNHLSEAAAALSAMVHESVLAQLAIRLFNLSSSRRDAFEVRLAALQSVGSRAYFHTGMVPRATNLASGLTQIVVVGAGAYLAFHGKMTSGSLIAFIGLLFNIGEAVNNITSVMPLLSAGEKGMKRTDEFLAFEPQRLESGSAVPVSGFTGGIEFADVGFSYDGSRRTLSGVTLTIRRGQSVAFVGPSGCGKSTMLALLLRLNAPDAGCVKIDGRPLEEIRESSLRELMSSVPQMPVLLSGTIADNLLSGKPTATAEELHRAMRRAAVDPGGPAFPQGLDTDVGLGGSRLSPGQRQRIAVARALLRDAAILVLDEATSALDPESESAINREIIAESGGRTVVSVTHRLASVTGFDRIFVFENGRLVEQGTHQELLEESGVYLRLWDKQQGFEIDVEDHSASVTPSRLRAIPFLAAAEQAALERFAEAFVTERFSEGTAICVQGDPADKFYILMRGSVAVEQQDADGETRKLATLTDGDFFGEIALVEDRPRTATVRARTPCWCLALPRKSFLDGLKHDPELATLIKTAIRNRLQSQANET